MTLGNDDDSHDNEIELMLVRHDGQIFVVKPMYEYAEGTEPFAELARMFRAGVTCVPIKVQGWELAAAVTRPPRRKLPSPPTGEPDQD